MLRIGEVSLFLAFSFSTCHIPRPNVLLYYTLGSVLYVLFLSAQVGLNGYPWRYVIDYLYQVSKATITVLHPDFR